MLIEDEYEISNLIKEYLTEKNFNVWCYSSGAEALKTLRKNQPDLLIVDLGLPDLRGESICIECKKNYPQLPIIILTGDSQPMSVVNLLNLGADDYITKPFNLDELVARIQARLRANKMETSNILQVDDLVLNNETLEVKRQESSIDLTAKEFELLRYLMINKNYIVSRDKILNRIWGFAPEVETRIVDVHIGKLRKKIDQDYEKKLIHSVRGFGYKIVD